MRKKIVFIFLFLFFMALFTGCGSSGKALVPNSYTVETEHKDSTTTLESSVAIAEDREELYSAVASMIEKHLMNRTIHVPVSYAGSIQEDVTSITREIWKDTPLGAYSVDYINTTCSQLISYYEVTITVSYRRSFVETASIRRIGKTDDGLTLLESALLHHDAKLVMSIEDYNSTTDWVSHATDFYASNSETVIENPALEVSIYPSDGKERIVEILFQYTHTAEELNEMQAAVSEILDSAESYVRYRSDPQAKAELLYTWLKDRFEYTVEETDTPAYSLLCEGICSGKALSDIYTLLCTRCEIPCVSVSGYLDGQPYYWNIITLSGSSRHLDLLRCVKEDSAALCYYYDVDLIGYSWDKEIYPACETAPQPPAENSGRERESVSEVSEPEQENSDDETLPEAETEDFESDSTVDTEAGDAA